MWCHFLCFDCSSAERQDVHGFLLDNQQNGGILELMMRYLKALGRRYLEEWPPGLRSVVLDVYYCWRSHSMGLPNPLLRDCSDQHIRVRGAWLSLTVGAGFGGVALLLELNSK